MRTLIVFFSFDGNTKMIAEAMSKSIIADLIELKTSKQYPTKGAGKYFWGGKSVVFGETPKLINDQIDLDQYETILIGTPVWAGSYTPPVKSFIRQYQPQNKRIALFACHGGGGAQKCFAKLKKDLPGNEFIGEIDFTDPKKNPTDNTAKARSWASGINTAVTQEGTT